MSLDIFIPSLHKDLNLPNLPEKTASGIYPVILNPAETIWIQEASPNIIFMQTHIGSIPTSGNIEPLLIHLMKANLLGQGTGLAKIGIDSSGKIFTLSDQCHKNASYQTFYELLENLANYTAYWKDEIFALFKKFL